MSNGEYRQELANIAALEKKAKAFDELLIQIKALQKTWCGSQMVDVTDEPAQK